MAWPKKFFGALSAGGPLLLQTLGPGPALDGPGLKSEENEEARRRLFNTRGAEDLLFSCEGGASKYQGARKNLEKTLKTEKLRFPLH